MLGLKVKPNLTYLNNSSNSTFHPNPKLHVKKRKNFEQQKKPWVRKLQRKIFFLVAYTAVEASSENQHEKAGLKQPELCMMIEC